MVTPPQSFVEFSKNESRILRTENSTRLSVCEVPFSARWMRAACADAWSVDAPRRSYQARLLRSVDPRGHRGAGSLYRLILNLHRAQGSPPVLTQWAPQERAPIRRLLSEPV